MLHVQTGDTLGALVADLVGVLRTPLPDPMRSEWIGIPTQGVMAWLEVELARHLGAQPGRGDGIAANIDLKFSGDLHRRIREARDGDRDGTGPWHIDRLVWTVVDVLAEAAADPASPIAPVAQTSGGTTLYGQARGLADLIDRYVSNRPEMVRRWALGDATDGAGAPIGASASWQPALFQLVRQRIGVPSPAERLDELLDVARADNPAIDLPSRISLFGFTSLPGGRTFLRQLEALGQIRDVHLYLWQPSPGLGAWVTGDVAINPPESNSFGLTRPSTDLRGSQLHPLVRSWAKPSREAAVLLADAASRGVHVEALPLASIPGDTLLSQLQRHLRSGLPSGDPFTAATTDDSLVVLPCHGQIRQVEVLRDEILHILDDDPTLNESDIVVLCPSLADYAPLIEAVFGPAAVTGTVTEPTPAHAAPATDAPQLAYQITDRSLTRLNPILGALASLLDMLSGRFGASVVSDFLGLPSVRARYGFSDDEFGTIVSWIGALDVRWGLDAPSRSPWIGDDEYAAGTWSAAIDRLLAGVALSDPDDGLSIGGVLPFGVEGTGIELSGRFAEFLVRLSQLASDLAVPRPIGEWSMLLQEVVANFFRAPIDQSWQSSSVTAMLADVAERANAVAGGAGGVGGGESVEHLHTVDLTLSDIRRLVADQVGGSSPATKFFRGGITVTSLAPLRGVPFRVVCILGFDDEGIRTVGGDGDDLLALSPMIGDRDRRADVRQSLFEAVMAAAERIVITRTGQSRVNNKPVPMTAALAELRDALVDGSTYKDAAAVDAAIERESPCNGFDPVNFRGDRRSFDPVAFAGALVVSGTQVEPPPFLAAPLALDRPLTVVELADLHRMVRSPVEFFLTRRLEVQLSDGGRDGSDDEIPLEYDALETWNVGERLLEALRLGKTVEQFRAIETAKGSLPPGVFGDDAIGAIETLAGNVLDRAAALGVADLEAEATPIDLMLPSGIRIVGFVDIVRGPTHLGPVMLGTGKLKPKRVLKAWLELLALTASHPTEPWAALLIGQSDGKNKKDVAVDQSLVLAPDRDPGPTAEAALDVLVDLYQRSLGEPLPIFPDTTPALRRGKGAKGKWTSGFGGDVYGERHEAATQLVFGDLEIEELVDLPARVDEQAAFGIDQSSRVRLYAERVWGTFDSTCLVATDAASAAKGSGDE